MTMILQGKSNLLMAVLAFGVFSVGTLLPFDGFSANCGEKGIVACIGNDEPGGAGTAPGSAPAPDPEPEGDCDCGCTD